MQQHWHSHNIPCPTTVASPLRSKPPRSNAIVLTALHDHGRRSVECCLDTNDYGTLVLQGITSSRPTTTPTIGSVNDVVVSHVGCIDVDLESLSTLQLARKEHNQDSGIVDDDVDDNDWNRVSIWTHDPWTNLQLTREEWRSLRECLHNIVTNRANERRRQQSHDNQQRQQQQQQDLIQTFLGDADKVFDYLIQTLNTISNKKTTNKNSGKIRGCQHHWTLDNILELHRQLEDLEFDCCCSSSSETATATTKKTKIIEPILDLGQNVSALTLQCVDVGNRHFTMSLNLSSFPLHISVDRWDVPRRQDEETGTTSIIDDCTVLRHKLKQKKSYPVTIRDLHRQFLETTNAYQGFWNELDDLDANIWVLEANTNNRSVCHRSIYLSKSAKLILYLDPLQPQTRPTKVQFLGSHAATFQEMFQSYSWDLNCSVRQNLEAAFGKSLARPTTIGNDQDESNATTNAGSTVDCGICFGSTSKAATTTTTENDDDCCGCENPKCARPFHNVCLEKWLTSLPTSRVSFDTMIGSCPYCKDPIAGQMSLY